MNTSQIVVDVGNSALHLGLFDSVTCYSQPKSVLRIPCESPDFGPIDSWLSKLHSSSSDWRWKIGSVNPRLHEPLFDWIQERGDSANLLGYQDFELPIAVNNPHTLGIDRLAAAMAANHLRQNSQAAIVVDAGTAITIDCVSADGVFLGGSIAPGLCLSFRGLNRNTAQLPSLEDHYFSADSIPPLIGNSTVPAIESGVYWLTVGGLDGLIARLKTRLNAPAIVIGTGGSMPALLPSLNAKIKYHPHLVLSGIALAKESQSTT